MDILKSILKVYPDWKGCVLENDYNRIIPHELETRPIPSLSELEVAWIVLQKDEKRELCKKTASDYILANYSVTTQSMINSLIGYAQQDKDTLWDFIKRIKDKCDLVDTAIANTATQAELDAVAVSYADITPNPTALTPTISSTTSTWFATAIKILTGIMVFVSIGMGYAEGVIWLL